MLKGSRKVSRLFGTTIFALFLLTQVKLLAQTWLVTDYGVKPDGLTLNTKSLQALIDKVAKAGGGEITVPPGKYIIGTIVLKDNCLLNLKAGAELYGSPNLNDYIRYNGHRHDTYLYHLVCAKNAKNVGIIGQGTINGNGPAFWEPLKPMPDWIVAKPVRVSRMVEFTNCTGVVLRDVLITNTPEWTLHLFDCDRVTIDGIRIDNNMFGPNADGIDLTGCQDVTISNCKIKTCDDGICLKTNFDSRETRRITVTNCIIETSCAALKLGNESKKDMKQIVFSNCVINNSSRAIGIYAEEGGVLEDISFSNIVADNNAPLILNRPIHITLWKNKEAEGKMGGIRNIRISGFTCKTNGRILITAEEGGMIENLVLRDISLEYPYIEDPQPIADSARSSQFSPTNKNARKQPAAIVAENVNGFVLDNINITWPAQTVPEEWKVPVKIENGFRYRTIKPDYSKPRQTEFSLLWGNNLQGGYIFAPLAESSAPARKRIDLRSSNIRIKE